MQAQNFEMKNFYGNEKSILSSHTGNHYTSSDIPYSENTYHLTINSDFIPNEQFWLDAKLISNELSKEEISITFWNTIIEPTSCSFEIVPPATYTFIACWLEPVDIYSTITHYVCKEITINQDTEIFISKNDTENIIKFVDRLPNGEIFKLPNIIENSDGKRERVWTNANTGNVISTVNIVDTKWRDLWASRAMSDFESDGTSFEAFDASDINRIYINSDVPENILVVHTNVFDDEKGERYVINSATKAALGSQTIYNDINNYEDISNFVIHNHSPQYDISSFTDVSSVLYFQELFSGISYDYPISIDNSSNYWTFINVTPYIQNGKVLSDLRWREQFNESKEVKPGPFGTQQVSYHWISSPWIIQRDKQFLYQKFDRSVSSSLSRFLNEEVSAPYPVYYPKADYGNEILNIHKIDALNFIGESVPFCSLIPSITSMDDHSFIQYVPTYIGQLGEIREMDLQTANVSVEINDKRTEYNYHEYIKWIEGAESLELGNVAISFYNNNSAPDGFQGRNHTIVSFDTSLADYSAPILNMLQFKNSDSKITNHFKVVEDGNVELYCGDFIQKTYSITNDTWYEEEEADVEVEYAPYGSEEFSPLEIEEIPELYFMPGFGHFYRGSLSGVDRASETGWFDLRIKLTDKAGNYQRQLISPAFKIDNLISGIGAVSLDNTEVRVEGHNIIAPAGSVIYTSQGIISSGSNVNSGIYVVKTPKGVRKVCVK